MEISSKLFLKLDSEGWSLCDWLLSQKKITFLIVFSTVYSRFAFAYFSSPVGAQQAVTTLNGKEVSGKNIVVRHVRDKSRARIIEGGQELAECCFAVDCLNNTSVISQMLPIHDRLLIVYMSVG